jgi:hypothetical protein
MVGVLALTDVTVVALTSVGLAPSPQATMLSENSAASAASE